MSMTIEFLENRDTILFGGVEAGDQKTGEAKDLKPFVDNGVAKIVKTKPTTKNDGDK